MSIKQIPDLNWKFDENVNQVTSKNPEMGKHGEHSPFMPEITGSAPEENEKKVEALTETTPEETSPSKTSQMKEEINAGSNPNSQIEDTEQAEVVTQTTDPEKAVEPVETTELVEAVGPAQATVSTETACTTEVSHIEEEKQQEYTPQSQPRSPGSPQVNGSIVNKLFSAFRPTTEENPQATPEYGLQL